MYAIKVYPNLPKVYQSIPIKKHKLLSKMEVLVNYNVFRILHTVLRLFIFEIFIYILFCLGGVAYAVKVRRYPLWKYVGSRTRRELYSLDYVGNIYTLFLIFNKSEYIIKC